jgi:hypothetical protein
MNAQTIHHERTPPHMLIAILLVAAFVLFVLAALNVPSSRLNLGWAGAACAALAWLVMNWPK